MTDASFLCPGPEYEVAALLLAILWDYLYPYHSGFMLSIHPVHVSYVLALKMYRPRSSRARGLGIWLLVMSVNLTCYGALLYAAYVVSPVVWVLAASYIVKVSASLRLLLDEVYAVARSLARGDLAGARQHAQGLVRRPLDREDEGHVASAAIESLAESLNDGFISPLFWLLLLGPLGALSQRVANTLDGALGFKDPDHADVGWASAWADTLINYVPARLTAALIVLASGRPASMARSLRSWLRCRGLTESRNAGHPMSAMAGALGVTLEKRGHYRLCSCFGRMPDSGDVAKAVNVAAAASIIGVLLICAAILLAGRLA